MATGSAPTKSPGVPSPTTVSSPSVRGSSVARATPRANLLHSEAACPPQVPDTELTDLGWEPSRTCPPGYWTRAAGMSRDRDTGNSLNELESRALVPSLSRIACSRHGHDIRQLLLVDNMAVALSFERHQSPNFSMLKAIRKFGGFCLARNIATCTRWIFCEANAATSHLAIPGSTRKHQLSPRPAARQPVPKVARRMLSGTGLVEEAWGSRGHFLLRTTPSGATSLPQSDTQLQQVAVVKDSNESMLSSTTESEDFKHKKVRERVGGAAVQRLRQAQVASLRPEQHGHGPGCRAAQAGEAM